MNPQFAIAVEPRTPDKNMVVPTNPLPMGFDHFLDDLFKGEFMGHLVPGGDPFANGWNAAMQYVKDNPMPAPTPHPTPHPAPMPLPVNVIFHDPATIVYWNDGTKTVVKCQPGDVFSAETGLTTAMLKKYMGNDNTFNRVINEWLKRTGQYHPALTT